MDWIEIRDKSVEYIKKYRYVALVLLAGLLLMLIPEEKKEAASPSPKAAALAEEGAALQDSLAQILAEIEGAGKVKVLLTQAAGEETVYQVNGNTNRSPDANTQKQDTVLITNAQREEQGLVRQINPPIYQGALIVCQGGDRPAVRLAIVQAVSSVTGLTSDCITVLKMK